MSKTFFYWLLGFRRFSAQEYDKEILNFRIDVSPMLFSATEKSYEQVDNNRFCSCSICSSLWFVKYNDRFCNRRQKKMYIKWFGFEPKKQRNTTRLQVVTLNQGHSLWFFSSFLPILLRNGFLSWMDPFSQPTLRKKKRRTFTIVYGRSWGPWPRLQCHTLYIEFGFSSCFASYHQ